MMMNNDHATGDGGDRNDDSRQTAIALGVVILGIVGLVMSMQSTSLMNGTTTIWLGVVLVAVSLGAACFLDTATGVKVISAILLALAVFSALYMEHQLTEKRQEITHIFDRS